jgi:predicted NUDIX family phosphoesterase
VPIEELKAKREQMETWSQLCLDNLEALLNAKHFDL